jgi:hypothetical protein
MVFEERESLYYKYNGHFENPSEFRRRALTKTRQSKTCKTS